jgi:hypothetical protein
LCGFVSELYLWWKDVPWTWWVAIGTVVTFAVGYVWSLIERDGAVVHRT